MASTQEKEEFKLTGDASNVNQLFGLWVQGFGKKLIWCGERKLLLTIEVADARFHYLTAKQTFVDQTCILRFSGLETASPSG